MPSSGFSPACAARPVAIISISPKPLRPVFTRPSIPNAGSSTSTASLRRASRSIRPASFRCRFLHHSSTKRRVDFRARHLQLQVRLQRTAQSRGRPSCRKCLARRLGPLLIETASASACRLRTQYPYVPGPVLAPGTDSRKDSTPRERDRRARAVAECLPKRLADAIPARQFCQSDPRRFVQAGRFGAHKFSQKPRHRGFTRS